MIFSRKDKNTNGHSSSDQSGMLAAIDRSQGVIEFSLDGAILVANTNFLTVMGYALAEVQGRHHSIFVDPEFRDSPAYRDFWNRLRLGEFFSDKFKRLAKGDRTVWIQASYNPIFGADGKPVKVVKFATDITAVENERLSQIELQRHTTQIQQNVVSSIAEALGKLAEGDLKFRMEQTFPESYDRIRTDLNTASSRLAEAMRSIATAAMALNTGTRELSSASDDLSRRTEQQAASLQETASALGELTGSVKKTSDQAKHVRDVVMKTRDDAQQSQAVMRKAVEGMSEIERSSSQISQIIGVIDEIAFQTNLLALNAGVEAARAGDAGRGFAVVASEVRALAQRSAEAAKQIKSLITASSQQVSSGVTLVSQTGQSLEEILGRIGTISEIVSSIATSAHDQAVGIDQVNTAVVQLDQITQQNAAMVEEATAACHNMARDADQLSTTVRRFRVEEGDQATIGISSREQSGRRRPANVASFRTASVGSAARKLAPAASEWEEF